MASASASGGGRGSYQIVAWVGAFMIAFPDASYELTWGYESGANAIDEGDFVGTNTGPLPTPTGESMPATGRGVRIRSCDAVTVEGGLVTSHRFYYDQMDFLGQLGLAPEA